MLVLSRRVKEQLVIGNDVVITVQKIAGNRITLSIDAPKEVRVRRGELSAQRMTQLELETRQQVETQSVSRRRPAPAASSVPGDQTHVAIASRPLA